MARVKIVLGSGETGKLMVVDIAGEGYPVLPSRPRDFTHLGPLEEMEDGRKLGTGFRRLNGQLRTVAWWADEEEVAKIQQEWREAIERSTIPAGLVEAMLAD